jgi:hypothetical protein
MKTKMALGLIIIIVLLSPIIIRFCVRLLPGMLIIIFILGIISIVRLVIAAINNQKESEEE